jgi:hypothetical protein
MKTTAKMIAMIFLLGAGTWLIPQQSQAHVGFSFQVFYDEMSPYGSWVDSPEYGYVWVPDAGTDFQPYSTNGYWVYSRMGWTWVSNYPWGWAPFHYGRWYFDNWYGWVWVPGSEWGPAWVSWRHCDGYYGWAPLAPGFNVSMSFTWNVIPVNYWIFVPQRDFGRHDLDRYYMRRNDADRLYRHSRILDKTGMDRETHERYFVGPAIKDVRKATGRNFTPVEIQAANRPGQSLRDGKMEVYRPKDKETVVANNRRASPEKYTPYKDLSRKSNPAIRENSRVAPEKSAPSPILQKRSDPSFRNEKKFSEKQSNMPSARKQQGDKRVYNRPVPQKEVNSGKPERQMRPVEKEKAMSARGFQQKQNSGNNQKKSGKEEHR